MPTTLAQNFPQGIIIYIPQTLALFLKKAIERVLYSRA